MKRSEGTWEQLLLACQKIGKENVIRKLEAYHKVLENMEASLCADPSSYRRARALGEILLQQDLTLIRLKQMGEEDIRKSLEAGQVGCHES